MFKKKTLVITITLVFFIIMILIIGFERSANSPKYQERFTGYLFKNIENRCNFKLIIYTINVGFPTITINEFRNNHYGRGGSTHHLHQYTLWGVK